MLFNSFSFLLFFPIVTLLYYILPHKYRWAILLFASCFFYMYFIPAFILVLLFTIVLDYWVGLQMEKAPGKKRQILILSLIANIGILFIFKYFNFFNTNLAVVAERIGWNYPIENLRIILPIGLSFHTFQAMSYTIEVYRGNQKAERHFGIYALYVMYYPQLVAGPIERPQNILHQFHTKISPTYVNIVEGLKRMLWGMFKKMVIADGIANMVNPVFGNPESYLGISCVVAAILFAFQIYCDFSGYSDIALGASRVMGITLMENFNTPYFSRSVSEFWSRWHISLSTWFKDYVYIPLGGNRTSKTKLYRNLIVIFLISGLWHGASWNFVIWGALHAFYTIFALIIVNNYFNLNKAGDVRKPKLYKAIQIVTTFLLVSFAWIFFRASDLGSALKFISQCSTGYYDYFSGILKAAEHNKGLALLKTIDPLILHRNLTHIWPILFSILILLNFDIVLYRNRGIFTRAFTIKKLPLRWGFYFLLLFYILFFGSFHNSQEFIYFQF
ncbi:MAG: MBOAT family protein [Bacteroidetes bacterium]|nr:MBOAT family protein [Bacteroidota bacterium]